MFSTCYCLLTDLHALEACEEPVLNQPCFRVAVHDHGHGGEGGARGSEA